MSGVLLRRRDARPLSSAPERGVAAGRHADERRRRENAMPGVLAGHQNWGLARQIPSVTYSSSSSGTSTSIC
jgi:hypothetical protein